MARIPDEEIERLKKEVDLAELVIRSGVALKKAGGDLVGCCPFHDDDTPSLVVTPIEGPLALHGGLPDRRLGDRLGDADPGGQLPPRHRGAPLRPGDHGDTGEGGPGRRRPRSCSRRSTCRPTTGCCSPRWSTTTTPRCWSLPRRWPTWPAGRSTTPRRSPGSASASPTAPSATACRRANRKAGAEIRGRLQRLGVYRASRATSTVPARWSSRSPTPPAPSPSSTGASSVTTCGRARRLHLYLPGPHRGVWNEEGLAGGEVILTESLIDALTFYCCWLPQRHRLLRHRRVHRRSRRGLRSARGHPGPHRLRPRRRRRRGGRDAGHRADGRRHRVLPGRLPLRGRCQRRGGGGRRNRPTPSAGCVRAAEWMGAGKATRRQAAPSARVTQSRSEGDVGPCR